VEILTVFPDDSCGIKFSGFNVTVECAWKDTSAYSLALPSNTPSKYLHARMGLSCQLPKKTQAALEKIKQNVYEKDPDKSHWVIRDMNKIISYSSSYEKDDLTHLWLYHLSISLRINSFCH
ncbi:hypothetical protein VP01_6155g1, partial [Puccinia sorghi]